MDRLYAYNNYPRGHVPEEHQTTVFLVTTISVVLIFLIERKIPDEKIYILNLNNIIMNYNNILYAQFSNVLNHIIIL